MRILLKIKSSGEYETKRICFLKNLFLFIKEYIVYYIDAKNGNIQFYDLCVVQKGNPEKRRLLKKGFKRAVIRFKKIMQHSKREGTLPKLPAVH